MVSVKFTSLISLSKLICFVFTTLNKCYEKNWKSQLIVTRHEQFYSFRHETPQVLLIFKMNEVFSFSRFFKYLTKCQLVMFVKSIWKWVLGEEVKKKVLNVNRKNRGSTSITAREKSWSFLLNIHSQPALKFPLDTKNFSFHKIDSLLQEFSFSGNSLDLQSQISGNVSKATGVR